jgi:SAM-dependent methyltransferase
MDEYFSGRKVYGDDFNEQQILDWFRDEEQGYANLGSADKQNYQYGYHALNQYYGFKYLPREKNFNNVLGFGSAYGDELIPLINRMEQITIIEPASLITESNFQGIPIKFAKPRPDGIIEMENNFFDLITCFSTLHHIPNVSKVISELNRVLKPGGYLLLREPTVSMGDWRMPRNGLTKRERGIPVDILKCIINQTGFKIVSENRFDFSLTSKLKFLTRKSIYNSMPIILIDRILCSLFLWNKRYHAVNVLQKFRPCSVSFVLKK